MPPYTHHGRVAFHETDAAGVVYFANYLRYAEEAETHALASCGFSLRNYTLPRVHAEADYQAPLHFWEEYTTSASIEKIGKSSLNWCFCITGPRGICATIKLTTARRDTNNRAAPYTENERLRLMSLQNFASET